MAHVFKTRQQMLDHADTLLGEMQMRVEKAPNRKTYNRLVGTNIPTKNDVINATIANLRSLNMIAQTKGWEPIYHDPEDQQPQVGTVS
jgi:hypothetical protein